MKTDNSLTAGALPGLPWLDPVRTVRNVISKRLGKTATGNIKVVDSWGCWFTGVSSEHDVEVVVRDNRFYVDVLLAGSNGAASAWRDGYWECGDLTHLFEILLENSREMDQLESGLATLGNWWLGVRHKRRMNTVAGSRDNIRAHYDLSNEMFALFLDDTMSYSAGIFENEETTLRQASVEKLDRICRKLGLDSRSRVLEIGSGWGGFAIHAATYYGCHVTTTTISEQQYALAAQRIHEQGLEDRIDLQLCDYRDLEGQYDCIVSVEMIEAVGDEFLPGFFEKCASLLHEDGQMLLQAITMPDRRYRQYLKTSDFIQQFIFPGSCVPSVTAMLSAAAEGSDLQVKHLEDIGPHYAVTLRRWLENFRANEDKVRALGFGDDFIRLWEYYFCYCEAGFRQGYTGDVQMVFNRPGCERPNLLGEL